MWGYPDEAGQAFATDTVEESPTAVVENFQGSYGHLGLVPPAGLEPAWVAYLATAFIRI